MESQRDWQTLSKSKHQERSCTGKVQFSKNKAITAAIRMQEVGMGEFDAYECAYCNHYHVGHKRRGVV